MNKVDNNVFIKIKPEFENLLTELGKNKFFTDISILAEKSEGKTYRHSKSGTSINDNMFATTGAVIRLTTPAGLYEYSFNNFSKNFLNTIPEIISKETGFSDSSSNLVFSETRIVFNKQTDYKTNPKDVNDSIITTYLNDIYNTAKSYSEKISDCVCVFQYLVIHKLFLSASKDLEQHLMWSVGTTTPYVTVNGKSHYYYKPYSVLGGAEILDIMNSHIDDACKNVIDLIDSEAATPGTYDVICMPDVTGLIAHEAFGHGVEEDMFVKDRALAKNYMNKQIASSLVTMHDNAFDVSQAATYFFDDEGELSSDTVIIDKGILVSGINDLLSAKFLNVTPTGNGRRESYERKVYTRMTNTYFEPGNSTLEEMISSVKYGYLLDNGLSGMEDPKNWGIQCMVNIGREIKDGKLTGKVISPVCLSGYVPDLLNSISMVSDTLTLSGSGYCGKGYKEWVKVSDGGPAIKARVTIS